MMDNYTSDSSDSDANSNKIIDFAYLLLEPDTVDHNLEAYFNDSKRFCEIKKIILHHNQLSTLPTNLTKFSCTKVLDISNNSLTTLPNIFEYCPLTTLVAKNNLLKNSSLPKCFTKCSSLRELNLSGNQLNQFPEQVLDCLNLKYLYLGGNGMKQISKNIWRLKK